VLPQAVLDWVVTRYSKVEKKFTNYEVKQVGCIGLCSGGPLIRIEPEGTVVSLKDIKHIDQVVEK